MADVRALIARLSEMDTCMVSDVLNGARALPGAIPGVRPMWPRPQSRGSCGDRAVRGRHEIRIRVLDEIPHRYLRRHAG